MKQTEKYRLNLMEMNDTLSPAPLNENAQTVDAAMNSLADRLQSKVHMAFGSYTGNGTNRVTIQTPGFKPQVVLMRTKGDWLDGGLLYYQAMAVNDGWCLWMGEERMTELTSAMDSTVVTNFDAQVGSLSWSTEGAAIARNNSKSQTYQWVAFGLAEE